MAKKRKSKSGRKPGVSNEEALESATTEYRQCRAKARDLGVSMRKLAEMADVPFSAIESWRYRYNPQLNNMERLPRVLALKKETNG